jgi:hypothetical protein
LATFAAFAAFALKAVDCALLTGASAIGRGLDREIFFGTL